MFTTDKRCFVTYLDCHESGQNESLLRLNIEIGHEGFTASNMAKTRSLVKMPKTITDKWPLRHMRLDDEVYEALMALKKKYGSPNKGLRAVLIDPFSDTDEHRLKALNIAAALRKAGGNDHVADALERMATPVAKIRNFPTDKKENVDKQADVGGYPGRDRHLDAVGPKLSDGIGKISHETLSRPMRPKGDKTR